MERVFAYEEDTRRYHKYQPRYDPAAPFLGTIYLPKGEKTPAKFLKVTIEETEEVK